MTSRVWSFVGIKVSTWRESFSGRLFLVAHLALPHRIVGVVFHVFLGAYDSPCSNWLYNPLSHESTSRTKFLVKCFPRSANVSVSGKRRRAAGAVPPRCRSSPATLRQHKLNGHMVLAEGSSNLRQRLSCLPAVPHARSLHRRKFYPYPSSHKDHLIEKRFISEGVASTG
jgi:hypothetical protein